MKLRFIMTSRPGNYGRGGFELQFPLSTNNMATIFEATGTECKSINSLLIGLLPKCRIFLCFVFIKMHIFAVHHPHTARRCGRSLMSIFIEMNMMGLGVRAMGLSWLSAFISSGLSFNFGIKFCAQSMRTRDENEFLTAQRTSSLRWKLNKLPRSLLFVKTVLCMSACHNRASYQRHKINLANSYDKINCFAYF